MSILQQQARHSRFYRYITGLCAILWLCSGCSTPTTHTESPCAERLCRDGNTQTEPNKDNSNIDTDAGTEAQGTEAPTPDASLERASERHSTAADEQAPEQSPESLVDQAQSLERQATSERIPEKAPEQRGEKAAIDAQPDTPPTPKSMGQACQSKQECKKGLYCKDPGGLGSKICTRSCDVQALPCPKGEVCEQHSANLGYCVPACQTHKDCRPHAKSIRVCNIENHCWKSWQQIGDQCIDSEPCLSGDCRDPGGLSSPGIDFKICTKQCRTAQDCGQNGYCRIDKGQKMGNCLRACTTDNDCQNTPSLPKCKNKTHCWKVE